jgi:hypothetical protein
MRPALLLALLLSTSPFACDKSGAPPPGPGAGSSAGPVETPPPADPVVQTPPDPAAPATVACGDKTCGTGEECISYYGIAGPRGPQFHECGIRCKQGAANDGCADGKRCQTIADGPGPVCR